ncbi:hypothetical protein HYFRA_00011333 [Hymenoscyphus fraxineus]|uniref:Uncharacterized protein n=1 Tax=Hymenoscyphus fraxineus TaxID=746836 RepID=A0A9N9KWV1_9HELO|nr:hypothetical protein HYFRA_00011333 [Hymenoscyphus fraxineus]
MDWMAANVLADVVVGLTFDERKAKGGNAVVFHPQNPQVLIWQDHVPKAVQKYASSLGKECEVVALTEWLKRVAEDAETCGLQGEELDRRSPGVKFLPVYELFSNQKSLPKFDLTKTLEVSEKLRNVEGIKEEWIENWCRGWMAQF